MGFKICVVGCGGHSTIVHGPSFKKYASLDSAVTLAACCDIDQLRAKEYSEKFCFKNYYSDVDEMLGCEKPDVISVITPVNATFGVVSGIIRQRIPVILEKPPGKDREETSKLILLAREYDIPNRVAFNRRYMPLIRELKLMMKKSLKPGDIQNIEYYMGRFNRRDKSFSTTAIHGIDAVRYIMGADYRYVRFYYKEFPGLGQGVANIFMHCVFDNDANANISFCPVSGAAIERVRIDASGNTFILNLPVWSNYDSPGRLIHLYEDSVAAGVSGRDVSDGKETFETCGFYNENASFFDLLRSGQKPHDLESALQPVELAECIQKRASEYCK